LPLQNIAKQRKIERNDFMIFHAKRDPSNKKNIAQKFWAYLYTLRARREDRRIGGASMDGIRPSRFRALGAEATQSSDYRCLDRMMRQLDLAPRDVFVDVGCGEGRVLTYLYLRKFRGRLIGVELDPDVAEQARQRTAHCANIEIRCANVLEDPALVQQATVYYLFNPFNGKIFSKFVALLEKSCPHPVRLAYLFDYYAPYLDGRPGWSRMWEGAIPRRGGEEAHGSIYYFDPRIARREA
jgi:SAM-dependent methyltransferase